MLHSLGFSFPSLQWGSYCSGKIRKKIMSLCTVLLFAVTSLEGQQVRSLGIPHASVWYLGSSPASQIFLQHSFSPSSLQATSNSLKPLTVFDNSFFLCLLLFPVSGYPELNNLHAETQCLVVLSHAPLLNGRFSKCQFGLVQAISKLTTSLDQMQLAHSRFVLENSEVQFWTLYSPPPPQHTHKIICCLSAFTV